MTKKKRAHKERREVAPAKKQPKAQPRQNKLWTWIGLGTLIVVVGIVVVLLRGSSEGLPTEVSVKQAYQMIQQGAFVLDVREPEEWNDTHIPNSALIPLSELPQRLNEVPRDQEIVVVCRTGRRSAEGRDILLKAGFKKVTSLTGGLVAWNEAGYPVASGAP